MVAMTLIGGKMSEKLKPCARRLALLPQLTILPKTPVPYPAPKATQETEGILHPVKK